MAARYTLDDVLEQLEDSDAAFSGEESDCDVDGVAGYLPEVSGSSQVEISSDGELIQPNDGEEEASAPGEGDTDLYLSSIDRIDLHISLSSIENERCPLWRLTTFTGEISESVSGCDVLPSLTLDDQAMESDDSEVDLYSPPTPPSVPRGRRGRGCRFRGRGRGRGRGVARSCGVGRGGRGRGRRCPNDGLSDGEREVLCGDWERKEPRSYVFPFCGPTPGPALPVDSDSPRALFERFYTDEVWEMIVCETNRYAAQQRQLASSPGRPWNDISVRELKAFVGMQIMMGICRLPHIIMYWSQHSFLTPGLSRVMTLTRFQQISRYFHLNNSEAAAPRGQPGWDPLYKLRRLLDLISPRLECMYNVHEQLSIDEAMIPFKGRLRFKQYMKDKPTKWGIKVFVLADATNGYVYRMQIYTGKNENIGNEVGLCSRVVLELMDGLEHTGPSVFMDNYYTSPWLFLTLYNKGVNACGTARKTRKYYPSELDISSREVESGYYDYRSSGPLLACVWKDKRIIHFMSTMHIAEATEGATVMRRRSNDGSRVAVTCPPCLVDYQSMMRGVDHSDQMIGYYNIGRRSVKWWKRGASHILEVCLFDAYTLDQHDKVGTQRRDYLAFRIALAEELIGSFTSRSPMGRPRTLVPGYELRLDQTKPHLPLADNRKLDCVCCSTTRVARNLPRNEGRHQTQITCSVCNVRLCLTASRNCFSRYHTVRSYWE